MSCACIPVLVGMTLPVLEIWLPFKNGQISLSGHGLQSMVIEKFSQSESAQKIYASRDWCQVHAHQFWWVWLLRFRRYGYLSKTAKFPFRGVDYKKFNRSESAQKIYASRDWCQVHAHQFWWVWLLRFQRYGYLSKTAKFPFRGMDYNSPWSSKNLVNRNRLKKFMQVGIDVKCMHTSFSGRGLSGFGDKISLWSIKVEKFNRLESAQRIYASRDWYHVLAHQFWWAWPLRFWRYGYLSKTAKFPFWGMDL